MALTLAHFVLHLRKHRLYRVFVFDGFYKCRHFEQKIRHQRPRCVLQGLPFQCSHGLQLFQHRLAIEQDVQLLPHAHLAIKIKRHRVKLAVHMQATPRQHLIPCLGIALGREIEHRHHRLGTPRQYRQFIFVLRQHRLTRIYHIHADITGQYLPQHLGLLAEFMLRHIGL